MESEKTLVEEMAALDPTTELVEYHEPVLPPPPSFRSVLLEFLKVLASSTTELHRLNCPAVLLSGVSILEYVQHWGDHPELLSAISESEEARDRIKAVVRWVLSTLWGSFASRTPKEGGFERKPYNPILGERFFGWWPEHGQEMTVEQVSHHPPISAFYLVNKRAGVHVNGHSGQVTKFTGTAIRYQQPGRIFVYVEKFNEEYSISMPELHIRGLLNGQPFVEITGTIDVLGTNDWAARLRFIPKPWFSGEYDSMEGVIFNNLCGSTIYDIWGNWKRAIYCEPHEPGRTFDDLDALPQSPDPSLVFFNASASPAVKPMVRPLDKQDDMESQKIWLFVTQALQSKDYKKAQDIKNAIEEVERGERKKRAEQNIVWEPKLFRFEKFCFMPNVDPANHAPSPNLSILSEPVEDARKEDAVEEVEESETDEEMPEEFPGRYINRKFFDQFVQPDL